ncbi:MAG: glycerophosphodiester phosphodiesterase family protein [Planctomycetota bacterium]|nr:glycerophosphodiester phosphodiesterase family protein [Planctomycetota bacterium]
MKQQVCWNVFLSVVLVGSGVFGKDRESPRANAWESMPTRGICAHRGASDTHPENTITAFREAIRLGAHMIEFDVALTADGALVLMHDATLDRTTNGTGPVSARSLSELQELDAGGWKADSFRGERIPTLAEALAMMPDNIWLNVHLKGEVELAEKVTRELVQHERLHQSFLACGAAAARAAKRVNRSVMICNMQDQGNSRKYVDETIAMQADFIQLFGGNSVDPAHTRLLRSRRVAINFCCSNKSEQVAALFKSGVEFPLVDRVSAMLKVADQAGIARLRPVYRSRLQRPGLTRPPARLLQEHRLVKGAAQQGLALSREQYFSSTAQSIFRYDTQWRLLQEQRIHVAGVNHVGAIDYHDGYLWAGMLHGPVNGKHDPQLDRSVIVKIRANDLTVVQTWDISHDVTWIDPVCFDGRYLWVGDLSDLGIHRYLIDGEKLVRKGVFRYPSGMHFSQGLRIVGNKMYTIHTFGDQDGLFEFDLPEQLTEKIQQPTRVWAIAENRSHLEGFDFLPGNPDQIWHAQGSHVDHYELGAFKRTGPK